MIAVIPARAGSVRLPGKNLLVLGGKTLVARALNLTMNARVQTFAVTDDPGVLVFDSQGTRMQEPPALAGPDVSMASVLAWVMNETDAREVMLLQPTSPLRTADDVAGCLAMWNTGHYDTVCTMTEARGLARLYGQEDCPPGFVRNGPAVLITRRWVLESGTCYGGRLGTYLMPPERSIDIDDAEDWALCQQMYAEGHGPR